MSVPKNVFMVSQGLANCKLNFIYNIYGKKFLFLLTQDAEDGYLVNTKERVQFINKQHMPLRLGEEIMKKMKIWYRYQTS
jgi:hypothetical protein